MPWQHELSRFGWVNTPSVGSQGDDYDNALAESIIGLYKTEVIHRQVSGRAFKRWSLPRLNGSAGFNHHRFLAPIGYVPTAEPEANYYQRQTEQAVMA